MKEPLKILLAEDDPDDAYLIERFLAESNLKVHVTIAADLNQYKQALEKHSFDVIISDHRLKNFSSLEALKIRNQKHLSTPFILVTGTISEELAIAVVKEGASDYILKDRLQRLPLSIKIALEKQRILEEKKQAEDALIRANERFQMATEASVDVIWDYDVMQQKLYCSQAFTHMLGHPSGEELQPDLLMQYVHPADAPEIKKNFNQFLQKPKNRWTASFRMLKADGTPVYVRVSATFVRRGRQIVRFIGVIQDVSEVVRLQKQIADKELIRQRQITEVIVQAQEKERREIGRELHDNVNQLLATSKLMIEIAVSQPDKAGEALERSKDALMQAIHEIRSISHSMIPPSFGEENFSDAVAQLVGDYQHHGLIQYKIKITDRRLLEQIDDEVKLSLYRILQESLMNVQKHAKASKVNLELYCRSGRVYLKIADDGRGFDMHRKKKGIGLSNISNRVELLLGEMELQSAPGKGTEILVSLPVSSTK